MADIKAEALPSSLLSPGMERLAKNSEPNSQNRVKRKANMALRETAQRGRYLRFAFETTLSNEDSKGRRGSFDDYGAFNDDQILGPKKSPLKAMRLRKNSRVSEDQLTPGGTPRRTGYLKKRQLGQTTCATPACVNSRKCRRKLAGKTDFYCEVGNASQVMCCYHRQQRVLPYLLSDRTRNTGQREVGPV